jgi:4-amino-4-deoxy-L-arabinose transferase-like glycosyltransferase
MHEAQILPLSRRAGMAPEFRDWADLDREEAERWPRRYAVMWEVLLVIGITAIGAGLRFMWLDKPAIWGDEAATYNRVCGTYADLVEQLRGWGFVPLHYEFYWWFRTWLLAHGHVFAPVLMRLPVAICGTLMVPAMYLLARQIVNRRAALATGLITATSAYMIFYSHDAKMYADSWLFCTLEMAAFIWWLRSGRVIAWLGWIAAGAIAVGLAGPGLALLGIQPILLIAQRHHRWWKTLVFLLGAAVIAAGPAYYYLTFTKWGENIQKQGWGASGLDWVNGYNARRDGPDLVRFTSTAYLFAWEWPTVDTVNDIDPTVLKLCEETSAVVAALVALGLFPWPTRRRYRQLDPPPPLPQLMDESGSRIVSGLHRLMDAPSPVAWWRSAIWISVWIIVPTYGMYLTSPPSVHVGPGKIASAVSPTYWFAMARNWLANPWHSVVAASAVIAAFYCCGATWLGRISRTLQLIGVLLVPLLICTGLRELLKVQSPGSLWMPRYLGFIWPAVAIAGVVLLLRLPSAPLRWGAIGLVVAMNLVNAVERMAKYSEPPMASVMGDLYDAHESHGRLLTVCDFVHGGAGPGDQAADGTAARYYLLIDGKTQIHPDQFYQWDFEPRLNYPRQTDPISVANDLSDEPHANRLIIWHVHHDPDPLVDYSAALGKSWRRVSAEQYHLFVYWNWNSTNWLDRQEWERTKG